MKTERFTPDDIFDYLNQELPGFEPVLLQDKMHTRNLFQLRVRATLRFAQYANFSGEHIYMAINGNSWQLKANIDEFIQKTRQDLIALMGLQKEIDAEVQRKLSFERDRIRQEEFQKAYSKALAEVAAAAAPSVEALRVFLNPAQDVEGSEPFGDDE